MTTHWLWLVAATVVVLTTLAAARADEELNLNVTKPRGRVEIIAPPSGCLVRGTVRVGVVGAGIQRIVFYRNGAYAQRAFSNYSWYTTRVGSGWQRLRRITVWVDYYPGVIPGPRVMVRHYGCDV